MRSARLSRADPSAPMTNPSCTDMVSQACPEVESPHSLVSAGTTAEAENQTDIARSSANASRAIDLRLEEGIFRFGYIYKGPANVNSESTSNYVMNNLGMEKRPRSLPAMLFEGTRFFR